MRLLRRQNKKSKVYQRIAMTSLLILLHSSNRHCEERSNLIRVVSALRSSIKKKLIDFKWFLVHHLVVNRRLSTFASATKYTAEINIRKTFAIVSQNLEEIRLLRRNSILHFKLHSAARKDALQINEYIVRSSLRGTKQSHSRR